MSETFRPSEATLGENCMYWRQLGEMAACCTYPKLQLEGRRSCEGMIDDVCLYMTQGRAQVSLTDEHMVEIKTRIPTDGSSLPPGEII